MTGMELDLMAVVELLRVFLLPVSAAGSRSELFVGNWSQWAVDEHLKLIYLESHCQVFLVKNLTITVHLTRIEARDNNSFSHEQAAKFNSQTDPLSNRSID